MNQTLDLYPAPKAFTLREGYFRANGAFATLELPVQPTGNLPDQGYRLIISRDAIEIQADSDAAAFYAGQTLRHIIDQCGDNLPCLTIEDWPDLPVRGVMLDVSRCKVPTMEATCDFIDWMASIKLNQLQLYIEHTFAFPGHEIVWEAASPFTPEEITTLDHYCRERHIELVPNFNSFGHMERWLRHAPYKHLAECPDGFYSPLLKKQFTHGTTLYPDKAAIQFLGALYDDFLPRFSSRQFNVGGDEPWELGIGRSAGRVEAIGKGRVYLDFMKEIHKLVHARDFRMMCWADIIMDHPEIIPDIPGDIIPVIWGYNGAHPFDAHCAQVAPHASQYYVAPGNNTWNSLTGRLDEALDNMRNAASNAHKHGAAGYLITTWGDNGNHQPWVTLYPGILQGACSAWGIDQNSSPNLAHYFDTHFFEATMLGGVLIQMGRLENTLPYPNPSHPSGGSPTHFYLFTEPHRLKELLEERGGLPAEKALKNYIETAGDVYRELKEQTASGIDAIALEEMILGLRMALTGAHRAGTILYGWAANGWLAELEAIRKTYPRTWLKRAREGGLAESMGYFDISSRTTA